VVRARQESLAVLTGSNRRGFDQALTMPGPQEDVQCNLLIDIDHLSANDSYGHLFGDKCAHPARWSGQRQERTRYGGEEFAICCRTHAGRGARVLE
jgi:diguanylate cyclase (GGDEF)-like protein